jgi:GTP 3',8-cyclase
MRDSYDRVIRYLRVSVTDRCNLRCEYCSPEGGCSAPSGGSGLSGGSGGGGRLRPLPLDSLAAIALAAVRLGADKVRITGGEPLLREGMPGFVARLAAAPGLASLSMTTNGTLLAGAAEGLAKAGLMSVNVSLDSVEAGEYRRMTGGGDLGATLAGIEAALGAGLAVKLNAVVAAGDEAGRIRAEAVERYASGVGALFQRIRRYDPASPKVYDPAFDRPPPCSACDRIRLLADGRLLACLHSSAFVMADPAAAEEGILACVAMKPRSGREAAAAPLREIGG